MGCSAIVRSVQFMHHPFVVLCYLRLMFLGPCGPTKSRQTRATSSGEGQVWCILQRLRVCSNARQHSAAVPPYRGHLHWGGASNVLFTAPKRLQQCSPTFRGSSVIQGPTAMERAKYDAFYSTCAPPALRGSSAIQGQPPQGRGKSGVF